MEVFNKAGTLVYLGLQFLLRARELRNEPGTLSVLRAKAFIKVGALFCLGFQFTLTIHEVHIKPGGLAFFSWELIRQAVPFASPSQKILLAS
ncbi:uncharacterized protein EKO05_0009605 [Ascochyta rabiei]|uniref:uncharacterized protein n=1 Tax=Didymella rabiei TaxID=5454 RepID=UPI00220847F7|nr:uncharacterized protein EKO05_0009605 [Ascochyta rabiei]UPX19338.1 hypothetical protein EKO05_0009605 [Ascochyta rabiei]